MAIQLLRPSEAEVRASGKPVDTDIADFAWLLGIVVLCCRGSVPIAEGFGALSLCVKHPRIRLLLCDLYDGMHQGEKISDLLDGTDWIADTDLAIHIAAAEQGLYDSLGDIIMQDADNIDPDAAARLWNKVGNSKSVKGFLMGMCKLIADDGEPIVRSMRNLSQRCSDPELRSTLLQITERLSDGKTTLYQAFSSYPKVFSADLINLMAIADLGSFPEVLSRIVPTD